MRKINKGSEPPSFNSWKRSNPTKRYNDLPSQERRYLRESCLDEQYHLCGYCCDKINLDSSVNEHVEAQDLAPNRTLDYDNIIASCTHSNQCDRAHKSQVLSLTPLMTACEIELKYYLTGRIEGLTDRAKDCIRVLNLGDSNQNNRRLISKRKQAIEALLYEQGESPNEVQLLEDELLDLLINDLEDSSNDMKAFSPVLLNVLKSWRRA